MNRTKLFKLSLAAITTIMLVSGAAISQVEAQGNDKNKSKQEEKALNKEAKKTGNAAEEAADGLGRDVVFCILAAHTQFAGLPEDSAQGLKAKYEAVKDDLPFGQFVAAVLLADRADHSLDDILARLPESSIGRLTKEFGHNMGQMRKEFNEFRKELSRSMTNPPTKDCFNTNP